jgi:hypothetical protein
VSIETSALIAWASTVPKTSAKCWAPASVVDEDRAAGGVELAAGVHVGQLEATVADAAVDASAPGSADDQVDADLAARHGGAGRIDGGHDAHGAVGVGDERHAEAIERAVVGGALGRHDDQPGAVVALDAQVAQRVVDGDRGDRLAGGRHLDAVVLEDAGIGATDRLVGPGRGGDAGQGGEHGDQAGADGDHRAPVARATRSLVTTRCR